MRRAQDTTNDPKFIKTSRAAFVRSCPESMPVSEVVELGRESGLDIKPQDVHAARYYLRQERQANAAAQAGLTFVPGMTPREVEAMREQATELPAHARLSLVAPTEASEPDDQPTRKPVRMRMPRKRGEVANVSAAAKRDELREAIEQPRRAVDPRVQLERLALQQGTERVRAWLDEFEKQWL